jgi:hypothetical protein
MSLVEQGPKDGFRKGSTGAAVVWSRDARKKRFRWAMGKWLDDAKDLQCPSQRMPFAHRKIEPSQQ